MNTNYTYTGNSNPLYLDKKLDSLDKKEINKVEYLTLYQKFNKTLYGICLRPFAEWNDSIYKESLSYHERKIVEESYMIYKIPFNILNNSKVKCNLVLLEGSFLSKINPLNYNVEDYNLCVLFLNLKYDNLKVFANQFNFSYKFKDFLQVVIMNNYYNINTNYFVEKKLINILKNIKGYNFWASEKNANLNQTLSFLARKIDFTNINKLQSKEVKDIIEDIRNKKAEDNDYLGWMHKSYHDLSSAIKKKGYALYKLDLNEECIDCKTFDNFIDQYLIKTYKSKNDIFSYNHIVQKIFSCLLTNKDMCHLVLKSKFIKIINWSEPRNELLYRYAFLSMKLEDCIRGSYTELNDRHMFTLEQAERLPSWYTDPCDLLKNPYFTFLASEDVLDIKNNFLPVEFDGYLVNMKEYKRRYCIFLTGKPTFDPLKNFQYWDKFAVTGSINFAIIPRLNGIFINYYFNEDIAKTHYPELSLREYMDISLHKYYSESNQYKNSDIDIMNNSKNWMDFFTDIHKFKNCIDTNTNVESNIHFLKTICIIVNLNFLKNYILELANQEIFDVDVDNEIIANFQKKCNEDFEIKNKIYQYYIRYQILENEKYLSKDIFKDKYYNALFDISTIKDTFILIKRSDTDWVNYFKKINNDKEPPKYNKKCDKSFNFEKKNCICDISINIKAKLVNSKLVKPFEIFRIKNNFCGITNRFHVDAVRALYIGPTKNKKEQVIMHPTAIAACKTGMAQYPKYFAGKRDYVEVANNYHRRGLGIILNSREKIHVVDYSFKVEKWKEAYFKDDIKKHIPIENKVLAILGEPYDKKIFQPNNKTNQTYRRQFHAGNNSKTKQLSNWLTASISRLYYEQHIPIVNGISPSNALQELQNLYKIPCSKSIINAQGYLIPFKAHTFTGKTIPKELLEKLSEVFQNNN